MPLPSAFLLATLSLCAALLPLCGPAAPAPPAHGLHAPLSAAAALQSPILAPLALALALRGGPAALAARSAVLLAAVALHANAQQASVSARESATSQPSQTALLTPSASASATASDSGSATLAPSASSRPSRSAEGSALQTSSPSPCA